MSDLKYGLGLARSEVAVRPYDAHWEQAYGATLARLQELFGSLTVVIEHVGSTAVAGLAAKPILDIALAFPDRASLEHGAGQLAAGRYERRGDWGDAGGIVFVEGPESARTTHLHLVEITDPQWQRYLRFRDLLRSDKALRTQYETLKLDLAHRFPRDRTAYAAGKDSFIHETLAATQP